MSNKTHILRFQTLVSIIVFSICLIANAEEKASETYASIAKKAAEAAEAAACKAIISRETAFNAVENAMAIQNDAEKNLLKLMRENNKSKIKDAKKLLEKAEEEAENARDITEEIIDHAEDVLIAAEAAKNCLKKATESTSKKEAESEAKKACKHSKEAEKNIIRAESLTEALKKKWLIVHTSEAEPEKPTKPSSSATNKKQ